MVVSVECVLLYRPPTEVRVTKETLPLRTARMLGIAAETSGKVGQAGRAELIRLLSHPLHRDRFPGSKLKEALLHQRYLEASQPLNNKRVINSTRLLKVVRRSKRA